MKIFGRAILASILVMGLSAVAAARDMKGMRGQVAEIILTPADLKWAEGPPALPKGAEMVVLEGDPLRPGPFTMRLKFPAGYKIPPHSHPGIERVTVISGTANLGKGETLDMSKGKALPEGSFFLMAPNTNHFAWTDEETVIQIHTRGPWRINYANPADDPRKK
ncbi:MAG: cupin domain-containing protein [Deltaproteobacteria bacterium]|nr:cupin domain-containing protein [Deltaproteobacteria bacterium]